MRPKILMNLTAAAACATLGLAACGGGSGESSAPRTIPQPSHAQLVAAGLDKLPLAPESKRIDIVAPTFSNPTEIDNPLFPISDLHSVIFSGEVDRLPFHTETTLLPQTRIIEWSPGQRVEAALSQYTAYVDGRIEEVAIDAYAQADDGSVWYLGEDVYDYNPDGLVDSKLGSWLAGKDGPPEMIMPAHPRVGDVHRAENIPAIAFEEVTVKQVDKRVEGPRGPVDDALVGEELHDDGTVSDKIFAPGYGEFFTDHEGDLEALALAVPTDALEGRVPDELSALTRAGETAIHATRAQKWATAATAAKDAGSAWTAYRRGQVPPRIAAEMQRALTALNTAIAERDHTAAGYAAIDVAQSALDLRLRYRPQAEIDRGRFELWADQVLVDAAAGDVGGVRSDVTTMEWIRDRFAHDVKASDLTAIDAHLVALRETVSNEEEDLETAGDLASRLRDPLSLGPVED